MERTAPEDCNDPKWDETSPFLDWKNYVHEWVREKWQTLTADQQRDVASALDSIASREEWD